MANADAPLPTQISGEHIKTEGWAIPLRTRKTNIKKGAEMRQLEKVRRSRQHTPDPSDLGLGLDLDLGRGRDSARADLALIGTL